MEITLQFFEVIKNYEVCNVLSAPSDIALRVDGGKNVSCQGFQKALLVVIAFAMLAISFVGFARGGSVHVKGYIRKDGTYVQPHYRSAPNGTKQDNWSTKGNVNPYTGEPGTKGVLPNGASATPPTSDSLPPASSANSTKNLSEYETQARSDCSYSIGTSSEKWCIEKRVTVIKKIESLKNNREFKHAYDDCSYSRGSTSEDWCVQKRIQAIRALNGMRQHRLFAAAFSDCSHSRGSTSEDWCVKKRIESLEAIEGMRGKPGFDVAWKNCSYSRGGTSEDYCIKKAMETPGGTINREAAKKSPGGASGGQASSGSSSCESGNWVDNVSSDGEIVKLSDGSVWEILSGGSVDSALWLPTEDIVSCDGKLINTDTGDKVDANRLK